MRPVLLAVVLSTASAAPAQPVGPPAVPEVHAEHFVYGYPTGTPITNDLIVRDLYAASTNDATRFADWVSYRLTVREVQGEAEAGDFERRWRRDPWLAPDETLDPQPATDDPYRGTGYDRGHLVPLAAVVGSVAVPQVNLYSVVVPQRPALNRGPWEGVEAAVRALVLRRAPNAGRPRPAGHRGFPQPDDLAAVWVLSGTLYEARDSLLTPLATPEPHLVPTGFWTVVAVHDDWAPSSVRAAAFAFHQDTVDRDPLGAVVSIDEVEARSGLDLFRLLPDAAEGPFEAAGSRAAARALLFPTD